MEENIAFDAKHNGVEKIMKPWLIWLFRPRAAKEPKKPKILQSKTIESWEISGEIVRSKNLNTTQNEVLPHFVFAANLCKDVADHDYYHIMKWMEFRIV